MMKSVLVIAALVVTCVSGVRVSTPHITLPPPSLTASPHEQQFSAQINWNNVVAISNTTTTLQVSSYTYITVD